MHFFAFPIEFSKEVVIELERSKIRKNVIPCSPLDLSSPFMNFEGQWLIYVGVLRLKVL